MCITSIYIPDVHIIEPRVFHDNRGYFFETFNFNNVLNKIGKFEIYQVNQSKSKHGVIRGLHFQKPPFTQAKIVRVVKGKVLDVIVDIRTDSPTFGQSFSIILDGTNKLQLFVPRGFAHGFITLSRDAIFEYIVDNSYAHNFESGIRFDDETLNIDWMLKYKISVNDKDRVLPAFTECVFNTKAEYNYNPIKLDY